MGNRGGETWFSRAHKPTAEQIATVWQWDTVQRTRGAHLTGGVAEDFRSVAWAGSQ